MSDDRPTTQKFLLDHLLRIVEGVWCIEEKGRTIWIFGSGDNVLVSLEDEAKEDKRMSGAEAQLISSSVSLDSRDRMGVPKWLGKIPSKTLAKDRQKWVKDLTEDGNWGIEEGYALEMLSKLDDMVDRAQKAISQVHFLPKVPREVDKYLSEAAACYRYGFDLACISLSRCALEEALKHRISASCGPAYIQQTDLKALIDLAAGNLLRFLDPKLQAKAHKIRVSGNDCAHGSLSEAQSRRTAVKVLKDCREIIRDLYRK